MGIAAAGKVLTDKGLAGQVILTGLGLPSEMADYIHNGVCPYMYLWNPVDLGYLTGYNASFLEDKHAFESGADSLPIRVSIASYSFSHRQLRGHEIHFFPARYVRSWRFTE